jgi:putative heme-binding domain-containing protein
MRHNIRFVPAIPLVFALALPLAGQHEKEGEISSNPAIGNPVAIEAGRKLFATGCAACHGADGQGGRGPNLREKVFWHPLDDGTLYNVIRKGVPGGGMPAADLPDDQVWQIAAFVRSLTAPAIDAAVPGDPAAGEALFWGKAGCQGCHSIRGRGGKLGPDLTNAGATRALPQLREDLLNPDADGAVGYRPVTVVLHNGETLKGVARSRTNYSLQLQDASGALHLLSMADVREMTLGNGSPMPKDYAQRLSRDEIQNLIAYLSRQSARRVEVSKK